MATLCVDLRKKKKKMGYFTEIEILCRVKKYSNF